MSEYLDKKKFLQKVFNYIEDDNLTYKGLKPCIIDFYADWCEPCLAMEPLLEEISLLHGEYLDVYRVDTQREAGLSKFFGIHNIPTLFFVPMTGQPTIVTGFLSRQDLISNINNFLRIPIREMSARA